MKNGKFQLDFDNDTLHANGKSIPLHTTHSGHYLLPLTKKTQLIHNLDGSDKIILTVSTNKSDFEIAQKLHRQFAHPTKDKLLKLVKLAGEPWNNNQNLHKKIEDVTDSCQTCEKYKRQLQDLLSVCQWQLHFWKQLLLTSNFMVQNLFCI